MVDRLHYVRLNVLGGVERLFVELMKYQDCITEKEDSVLSATTIHPLLIDDLANISNRIYYLKRLGSLPIPRYPRFLRSFRARQISAKTKPNTVVSWNVIGSNISPEMAVSSKSQLVHYEHGAAWDCDQKRGINFLRSVDRVVCASRAAKRIIEERWAYKGDIRIQKNVLLPSVLEGYHPRFRKQNTNSNTFVLGAAGRLVPVKGFYTLLPLIDELKNRGFEVNLLIAGDGPEKNALIQKAKKLNLQRIVHFLGAVNKMSDFYSQIDMLIIPSLREPFGLVSLEAAAHGIPVVASRIDGLPETVVEGVTGTTIIPSVPLSEFKQWGGNIDDIPSLVYDPQTDSLVQPRSLDPGICADAVVDWLTQKPQPRPLKRTSAHEQFMQFAHALKGDLSL